MKIVYEFRVLGTNGAHGAHGAQPLKVQNATREKGANRAIVNWSELGRIEANTSELEQ